MMIKHVSLEFSLASSRLCSNVVKSTIIPTVLVNGSQRIEKFIEAEKISVDKTEQVKVRSVLKRPFIVLGRTDGQQTITVRLKI